MQGKSKLDAGMRFMVQGLFLAFPLGCIAGVATELWIHGFQSVFLQIGVGIFGLFVALRLFAMALSAVDEIVWSTKPFREAANLRIHSLKNRMATASAVRLTSLSHA